jgi:hypothetical protein
MKNRSEFGGGFLWLDACDVLTANRLVTWFIFGYL